MLEFNMYVRIKESSRYLEPVQEKSWQCLYVKMVTFMVISLNAVTKLCFHNLFLSRRHSSCVNLRVFIIAGKINK